MEVVDDALVSVVVVVVVVDDDAVSVAVDDIDITVVVAVVDVVATQAHIFKAKPVVEFATSGWYVLSLALNLTWIPSIISKFISH